jgi:S1-C subfamily serine protease
MTTRHRFANICLLLPTLLLSSADAQTNSLRALSDGIRQLVDRVTPAVVQISARGITAESNPPRIQASRSNGSGVLVDAEGYIITNAHVVGAAQSVQVMLAQTTTERDRFRSVLKPSGKLVTA